MQTDSRYPWGKGTPTWDRDAATNDSDKTFTVPDGKIWKLMSIWVELQTTADAGNRYLRISISNGTNNVYNSVTTGAITASQYGTLFVSYEGISTTTTQTRGRIDAPQTAGNLGTISSDPCIILTAGYIIRVWDTAAVAAALDDLIVVLHYVEYDA